MEHFQSLEGVTLNSAWLTIGAFDGVHRGHQAIIRKLTAGAHSVGAPAVVLTFHPHPAVVLRGRQGPYYLSTPDERAAILGALGVDVVITHPFNQEVANLTAGEFLARLKHHLGLSYLIVGHDFAFGHGREGTAEWLGRMGEQYSYKMEVMEPIIIDGQVASSSQVRLALTNGYMELVAALLGRLYTVSGAVVEGDGRGRTIGIPTANLDIWPERALPCAGVYACLAHVNGETYQAVTNIGYRPTFESQPVSPRVETHLMDYQGTLYGCSMSLSFARHLRDEQRFSSAKTLIEQIQRDIAQARIHLDALDVDLTRP
jgi:riboflavin kinase/FMN adenylyltransferase